MNFLAPLFLAGAAAIAFPLVFHLVRRTSRTRTPFSSLRFLESSPPRVNRSSRLEHLLLLLLRCAVLALLAFGFARPFLRREAPNQPPPNAARRVVLLVDTSASMQRAGLWNATRDLVERRLRAASAADEFSILAFDRRVVPAFGFDDWRAAPLPDRANLALARFDVLRPGWSSTHLGNALVHAADALADQGDRAETTPFSGHQEIVVISDLQESSHLEPLQSYDWPKGISVVLDPVRPAQPGNAGIQTLIDPAAALAATGSVVRVRVANAADSRSERFVVSWLQAGSDLPLGTPQEAYVPPGQSRIVLLPLPTNATTTATSPTSTNDPARPSAADRIVLRGDDESFDNTLHVVPPEPLRIPILYLGTDTGTDGRQPLYFLRRALPSTAALSAELVVRPPAQPIDPATLDAAALVVVTEALPPDSAATLHRQVQAGKTILFAPRTAGDVASLGTLAGTADLPAEEARPTGYAMLGELDFRHPVLAAFADPRFSDFTRIHFWRYRRLDPATLPTARLIARFDNGDPAWIDLPVGRGRVFVLASGWHPEDSQLALSTKFVPLLFGILEASGTTPIQPAAIAQVLVGDSVPIPPRSAPAADAPITIRTPRGETLTLPADATRFDRTDLPGLYEISIAGTVRRFGVNLDPAESLTVPKAAEDLERLGAPLADSPDGRPAAVNPARTAQLAAAEAENRQKLWRWFILATLLVLLVETLVAGWTLRRTATPEVAL